MGARTNISWTDSTFNGWIGCTKVGPGCDHCYAEALMDKRHHRVNWGAGNARSRTSEANWKLPKRWDKEPFCECPVCGWRGREGDCHAGDPGPACPACGNDEMRPARRRVFCASLADWLDNDAPLEWLVDLLDLVRRTPNLDWLLLTKRIGNFHKRLREAAEWALASGNIDLCHFICCWLEGRAPANVWLGATVVNQEEADRDIPKLLSVPARVRFLSVEPMLGRINLTRLQGCGDCTPCAAGHEDQCAVGAIRVFPEIDWVIAGGESGPRARPSHPDWHRSLRDQCAVAGVPYLFKQWGEWAPIGNAPGIHRAINPEDQAFHRVGKKAAGRLLDGTEHNGFPA